MNIKVIVATHKKYKMPTDTMYLPVQVGAEGKKLIGYQPDNEGENISKKNPNFCELTGLYWAWKNLDCDYLGLVHYRRYFSLYKKKDKFDSVLSLEEAEEILKEYDCILPNKRNYFIETIYSHYKHTHYKKDLDTTRSILEKLYPEYLPYFDKHMKSTKSHMFNMFIMKREFVNQYLSFLFDVLFELEKQLDISEYDAFQARLFGRISEILLDVWIEQNQIIFKEVKAIHMEPINWWVKGTSFLKAKFFGEKYNGSF